MTPLLLCLALATQLPEPVQDWAFLEAQEETIRLWTTETRADVLRAIPVSAGNVILRMGVTDWRKRDEAKAELRAMGPDIAPWLVWGQHLHDAEIWLRCRNLLREFSACPMCEGLGSVHEFSWITECRYCNSIGRFYPMSDFLKKE